MSFMYKADLNPFHALTHNLLAIYGNRRSNCLYFGVIVRPTGTIVLSFVTYNIPMELPTGSSAVQEKMMISTSVCKHADLAFSPVAQHLIHVPSLSISSKHSFNCG